MNKILFFIGGFLLGALVLFVIFESIDVSDSKFNQEKQRLNDSLITLNQQIKTLENQEKILQLRLLAFSQKIDSLKGGLGKIDSTIIDLPPQERLEAYLDSIIKISKGEIE